jgi:hypothetical protein
VSQEANDSSTEMNTHMSGSLRLWKDELDARMWQGCVKVTREERHTRN